MADWDKLKDFAKDGDIHGAPFPGHKLDTLYAAVIVREDGEGLLSVYTFSDDGDAMGRLTFVCSSLKIKEIMDTAIEGIELPENTTVEWREFHVS